MQVVVTAGHDVGGLRGAIGGGEGGGVTRDARAEAQVGPDHACDDENRQQRREPGEMGFGFGGGLSHGLRVAVGGDAAMGWGVGEWGWESQR